MKKISDGPLSEELSRTIYIEGALIYFLSILLRNIIFNQARKQVMGLTKGLYPAPLKILDVTKTGLDKGVRRLEYTLSFEKTPF